MEPPVLPQAQYIRAMMHRFRTADPVPASDRVWVGPPAFVQSARDHTPPRWPEGGATFIARSPPSSSCSPCTLERPFLCPRQLEAARPSVRDAGLQTTRTLHGPSVESPPRSKPQHSPCVYSVPLMTPSAQMPAAASDDAPSPLPGRRWLRPCAFEAIRTGTSQPRSDYHAILPREFVHIGEWFDETSSYSLQCSGSGKVRSLLSPSRMGSPLPHLHRDLARPGHVCTGTGLAAATITRAFRKNGRSSGACPRRECCTTARCPANRSATHVPTLGPLRVGLATLP